MDILFFIGIGLAVGAFSGVMGIGGGVLIVPALIWLCGFDIKKATGTSLAILVPPIGLPAAVQAFRKDQVDIAAALWVAAAFVVGAYASRALIEYLPEQALRLLFGLLMVYIAFRFMLTSSSEATTAVAGLIAVVLAWLAFCGLRALGRRHVPRPDLADTMQRVRRAGHGDVDYHI
jgi:uncharacterized protein